VKKNTSEDEATPIKIPFDGAPMSHPPGMNAPPGLNMVPPGLVGDAMSARHLELAAEAQRLQEDRQRLVNERLELETARLAHENAMLRVRLQYQVMPTMMSTCSSGPPGVWASAMTPCPQGKPWGHRTSVGSKRDSKSSKNSSRRSVESQSSTVEGSDSDVATGEESEASAAEEASVPESTVMMRNIPNSYTRERLLFLLDSHGFAGFYDLVYLPIDFTSRSGLGYAFINFRTAADARRFREYFHGFDDWGVFSEKACDAHGSATHQGLEANIERYRNSPMMHESVPDEFRPVIFKAGVRVPFPPPTRRLRAPDLRRRNLTSETGASSD